jgi:hypothetical protein
MKPLNRFKRFCIKIKSRSKNHAEHEDNEEMMVEFLLLDLLFLRGLRGAKQTRLFTWNFPANHKNLYQILQSAFCAALICLRFNVSVSPRLIQSFHFTITKLTSHSILSILSTAGIILFKSGVSNFEM